MAGQKIKSLLLALSMGTASMIAASNGAHSAAPELYFYPAQSWSVSAGATDIADASVQNCSIKNEFNNGFVIQLDGSHKWVTAMSVDFRQGIFNVGEMYDVSFTVPGTISKNISTYATTGSVLVFDMQGQKDLYQAMRDSAVLDLSVEDNAFRFYLTGFSNAAAGFERCMAGGSILQASMSEDPFEDSITLNESIAFEDVEKGAVVVQESLEAVPPLGAIMDNIAQLDAAPLESTLASVSDAYAPPENDRKRMSEILAEEMDDVAGFEDMVARASEELVPLQEVEPVEASVPVPERPEVKIVKETTRIEVDFTDMDVAEVEPNVFELNMDSVEPASASMMFESRRDPELVKKISQLERIIDRMGKENVAMNEELQDSLQASETERMSISSDNWNLERATMRYNESERQIKRIGQQLQRERAQCKMEKKDLEALLFDPQVTSQQQLARLSSLERQLEEAREKLRANGL